MKKTFFYLCISLFTIHYSLFTAFAQVSDKPGFEIGIDEHLDKTIPLNLKFCTEKGDTVTLAQLIDKPTVLSFVYFDCPGLCPLLQQGISDVIDNTNLKLGKDYKVITISFNYRDDHIRAEKKKKNYVPLVNSDKTLYWTYLTADSTSINNILCTVGYKIKIQGVNFSHPSGIVIVSPKGIITRYLYGVSFLPLDFKMAIIEAQKGLSRPTSSKFLSYCFAYDPQGHRYKLEVTKIAGTIIVFLGLVLLLFLLFRPKRKQKIINNETKNFQL